jgi:hypothetical protein
MGLQKVRVEEGKISRKALKVFVGVFLVFVFFILFVGVIIVNPFGVVSRETTTLKPTTITWTFPPVITTITTTSTTFVTTTTTATTTTSTTTTTTISACRTESDCGERYEEFICIEDNVYRRIFSYRCENPGRHNAECTLMSRLDGQSPVAPTRPYEICEYGCENGTCKTRR